MKFTIEELDVLYPNLINYINSYINSIVIAQKDEIGIYLTRLFSKEPIEENRCIKEYIKNSLMSNDNKINKIYLLTDITCGGSHGCKPGFLPKDCDYTKILPNWSKENPIECALSLIHI